MLKYLFSLVLVLFMCGGSFAQLPPPPDQIPYLPPPPENIQTTPEIDPFSQDNKKEVPPPLEPPRITLYHTAYNQALKENKTLVVAVGCTLPKLPNYVIGIAVPELTGYDSGVVIVSMPENNELIYKIHFQRTSNGSVDKNGYSIFRNVDGSIYNLPDARNVVRGREVRVSPLTFPSTNSYCPT